MGQAIDLCQDNSFFDELFEDMAIGNEIEYNVIGDSKELFFRKPSFDQVRASVISKLEGIYRRTSNSIPVFTATAGREHFDDTRTEYANMWHFSCMANTFAQVLLHYGIVKILQMDDAVLVGLEVDARIAGRPGLQSPPGNDGVDLDERASCVRGPTASGVPVPTLATAAGTIPRDELSPLVAPGAADKCWWCLRCVGEYLPQEDRVGYSLVQVSGTWSHFVLMYGLFGQPDGNGAHEKVVMLRRIRKWWLVALAIAAHFPEPFGKPQLVAQLKELLADRFHEWRQEAA